MSDERPDLPEPLAPWSAQLAIFPLDLALGVGPLVQRLAAAIGPLRDTRAHRAGEVDGLGGLARRGPYDRLLLSEWLLLDELPDEFLRRAASSEHGFLDLQRRTPGRTRRSLALVDAGPDQLGGPRVVQLAALIVLAARAAAAGVRFGFGLIQQANGEGATRARLHDAVTRRSIQALLDGRTRRIVDAGQLRAWGERLAEEGTAASEGRGRPQAERTVAKVRASLRSQDPAIDDLWILGSPRAVALAASLRDLPAIARASTVALADRLEPGVRAVDAEVVAGRAAAPRRLLLSLPSASTGRGERDPAVWLLRTPFSADSPAPSKTRQRPPRLPAPHPLRPGALLLFSADARRLIVRALGGAIIAFGVPNSPRAQPIPPLIEYPDDAEQVVAAGTLDRNLIVVSVFPKGRTCWLVTAGRRRSVRTALPFDPEGATPSESVDGEIAGPWFAVAPTRQYFLDAAMRLFVVEHGRARELLAGVQAINPGFGHPLVAQAHRTSAMSRRAIAMRIDPSAGPQPVDTDGPDGLPFPANAGDWPILFGFGRHLQHPLFGVVAFGGGPSWRVRYRDPGGPPRLAASFDVRVPAGCAVVGPVVEPGGQWPLLAVIDKHRSLALVDAHGQVRVIVQGRPVRRACVATGGACIAWSGEAGDIHVYSLERHAEVLHVRASGEIAVPG